jgi:hypothetical protein
MARDGVRAGKGKQMSWILLIVIIFSDGQSSYASKLHASREDCISDRAEVVANLIQGQKHVRYSWAAECTTLVKP